MQTLETYLTRDGWKNDWNETKRDLASLALTQYHNKDCQQGSAPMGCLFALAAMPVSALTFMYLGEGMGWISGNILDMIPYARDVAPMCVERAGLVIDHGKMVGSLNENIAQTAGAISGFWGGLWLPPKLLAQMGKPSSISYASSGSASRTQHRNNPYRNNP